MRFPEFSGEWSKYKVSDFLEFFPTNSLSWDQLEYSGNEPLNLHYGLIHNGLPVQIEVSRDALPSIKEESFPKKFTFCKDGDIAFADASEDTNDVGKAVEFYNCAGKKIVCGLHTIHGRDKLELTSIGFKGYLFSSKVYHDQIKSIAQGTKVFSIKTSNFDEVILGLPEKEEQGKISRLMMAIDERISTQSKIIEEQETLLKSLADKLFNTLDIVTKLHLGDISELYQPKTIPLSNLSSKGYPVYGANGIIGSYKNFNHITEQICIACRGSSCGSVNYTVPKAWITGNAMVVNTDNYSNIIDKRYLYYYLRCINYSSLISGSGQPQIVRAPLANLLIPVPTLEKQKHVVLILDTVAKILGTNKTILLHYQNQKAYLLSHMFI